MGLEKKFLFHMTLSTLNFKKWPLFPDPAMGPCTNHVDRILGNFDHLPPLICPRGLHTSPMVLHIPQQYNNYHNFKKP